MSRLDTCDRIRPLLANLVDATPADVAPATRDAIRAHVAWCDACESALAELVLTGYAVRRTLTPATSMEPPADAWPRLRARVARRSPGLGFAGSSLAGLLVGAAVAVMLVVPFTVPKPAPRVTQEIGLEVIVTSGAETPDSAAPDSTAPDSPAAGPAAPSSEPASSAREDRVDEHWLIANLQARHDATPPDLAVDPRVQLLRYGEPPESRSDATTDNLPRIQFE